MSHVQVPEDLSEVKTKLALSLTKRQLICLSDAAAVGVPACLLTRSVIGNTPAMLLMVGLILPSFFFAIFKYDGPPLEKILRNFIRARLLWPQVRLYKTESFYTTWSGPGTSDQLGPKQEGTPRGGTGIVRRENSETVHIGTGRR